MVAAPDPPWEWRDGAACKDSSVSLFFAEDWEEGAVESAKAVCAACPVRVQCLDFAIGTREKHGIWGGLTANERRSLINKLRRNKRTIPKYHIPMPRAIPDLDL